MSFSLRRRDVVLGEFTRWGFDRRGWSDATRDKYYRECHAADRWLTEHCGTNLIYAGVKDLKAYLFSTTPDPRTRNNKRQAMVAFGCFLLDTGVRDTNAAVSLPRLPEPRSIPKALTLEQARAIALVAPSAGPMRSVLVLTFLYAGLRLTEGRTLRWSNVDWTGWFRLWGKGQKEREVPIHGELMPPLRYWHTFGESAEWVFPSPFNSSRPLSKTTTHEIVRDIGQAVGIQGLYPHMLRHTAATLLYEATGGDVRTVQEFLGHSSLLTTQIYAKVRPIRLQEAVGQVRLQGGDDGSEL